jgi:hypothetical protein
MKEISPDEAFQLLAKWKEEGAVIPVALSRPSLPQAAATAVMSDIMPHSRKVLVVLRDENGDDLRLTVSLEGAAWTRDDAGVVLAATFPNGNRYVFGSER